MLPDVIQLEVVTPDRSVLRASVAEVQVPGLVGYLGVLPGHTPLLAELGLGQLSYRQGSQTFYATAFGGLAEILPDRVIVLAEAAERAEEINVDRARAAADRAKKRIASPTDTAVDWERAQRAAQRAETRLQTAARVTPGSGSGAGAEAQPAK
jgi:F-type H+-transporting ATPase subunit epsilon